MIKPVFFNDAWLSLACASKHEENVASCLAATGSLIVARWDHIVRLIESGLGKQAVRLIDPADTPISISPLALQNRFFMCDSYFSKQTEMNLPAFLAAIPDPGQRYRAEVMVSFYPNPEKPADQPSVTREQRLRNLAPRFRMEAPPESHSRIEILAMVSAGPHLENLAEMRVLADKLTFDKIQTETDKNSGTDWSNKWATLATFRKILLIEVICQSVRENDLSPLLAQFEDYAGLPGDRRSSIHNDYVNLLTNNLPQVIRSLLYPQQMPIGNLLRDFAACSTQMLHVTNRGDIGEAYIRMRALMVFAAAGQGAQAAAWWQPFSKGDGIEVNREFNKIRHQIPFLSGSELNTPDHPFATRDLLVAIFKQPELRSALIPDIATLRLAWDHNQPRGPEEFAAAIAAIPDDDPMKADFTKEFERLRNENRTK